MVKLQYMGLLAIVISSILALSVTLPAASALIQRDNFDDSHTTTRFLGGIKVCGEHICKPGESNKMLKALNDAQHAAAKCREALKQGKKC
ncbi:MAG: hypothetical protein E6L00_02710 [Thaumarchaeota archaeon]|nr:MAG: hypothetical protein E6L00_02710 [Nitrososphaerota archaeon]